MPYKVSEIDMQFLSNLVSNPSSLSDLEHEVSTEDFDDPLYYEIYVAIVGFLIEKRSPTLADLKLKFRDDALVIDVIEQLRGMNFVVSNINEIHEILRERSKKRKLQELSSFLSAELKSAKPSEHLIALIESKISQVALSSDTQIYGISDLASPFLNALNDRVAKFDAKKSISEIVDLSTGFEQLDEITLGLPLGSTTLIGASTSDGKTQLALQISNAVTSFNHGAAYFLFEDSKDSFLVRMSSLNTGIPIRKIRSGNISKEQVTEITEWLHSARESNRLFVDDNMVDINDAISKAKFMKLKFPYIKLFVFDNINLIRDYSNKIDNREREISLISKKILGLARTTNTSAIILQQLNTNPDDRSKGLPITNNDLRDSKAPSHDASVCIYIHFPDKYDEHKKFSREHGQFIIGKNRNGEPHRVVLVKNEAHIGRFTEKENRGI